MIRLLALLFLTPSLAWASNCALRPDIAHGLTDKYGEHLSGIGVVTKNGEPVVLELWVNDDTETFTILMTYPTGIACMMAAGENYSDVAAPKPGDPM